MNTKINYEPVVLLVDNKTRDLDVAVLIAFHLKQAGIDCYLEPLEAFRAALGAHKPGMIIFNHLLGGHLVKWSQKLAAMNVLTAVLPNEGIAYDPDDMRYIAGKHHNSAHIDYMLSWNEPHKHAVLEGGSDGNTEVDVVGIPRFDFYFKPWSALFSGEIEACERPKILVCANFVTARYHELPDEFGDRFFAPWVERVPITKNYRQSIAAHWRARNRLLDYVTTLVDADKYDVTLRPHPNEDREFYFKWYNSLPAEKKRWLKLETSSNITGLILNCDLEISCETCTTALESWISGKPTIELIFERDPYWYRTEQAGGNVECSEPSQLVAMVDAALKNPEQAEKRVERNRILQKWCNSPDGTSSEKIAQITASAIKAKRPADWSQLDSADTRRAFKLKAKQLFGYAYHYDVLMPIKRLFSRRRYATKDFAYKKSIEPRDVREAQARLKKVVESGALGAPTA